MKTDTRTDERIMDPEHPDWHEFVARMDGEEYEDWDCGGGTNKDRAIGILKVMGLSDDAIEASCEFFESMGGYCDCEIIVNVAWRV